MNRQAIIERLLDHYDHPRHQGALAAADVVMPGGIPSCGDTLTIYLKVDAASDQISALSFEGHGCTISQAAASLLAEHLQGQPLATAEFMDDATLFDLIGPEVARSRPRCASLALNTLKAAIMSYRRRGARS
ncbi:iron-sulfur cluster assembly scaffold protein [Candidatus Viridilinea mediisalina]|uniref:Iron-sulfur cluster assembly scaffold protein n=1 Tax=Candidatus Viridilinea mediisalina TaxID=2024553 RepID=A0A2A6RI95_9CHLR|nr:iron-sulfur cluster assembly scaffold protein [Candidatus Viridilinea mediisalina]PDW02797.1 iron-sulfur cluster assembly scaffold protein [Candidatus Viridilinea mediisalina]